MTKYSFIGAIILFQNTAFAQHSTPLMPKPNWYNLDLQTDGMFGISIDRAYKELLKGKKAVPVIVAVIDGGVDVKHEDLKNVVWTNKREIPGNGRDDDKNGYTDDINGWNFLGSSKESWEYDNDQIVVEQRRYQLRFGERDSTQLPAAERPEFRKYLSQRDELAASLKKKKEEVDNATAFMADMGVVLKKMGKENPSADDFRNYQPATPSEARLKQFMLPVLEKNPDLKGYMERSKADLEQNQHDVDYHLNMQYDPRAKYADEFAAARGRFYGNGNVYGAVPPAHGTHVAGTIAAARNNNIGINGVADHVQVMAIRAIPDGYGLDRDEAAAIRYAADNGAKVINMSFGLSKALDPQAVEEAVNYALSKDILFIQAAGNGHDDLDKTTGYPNRKSKKDERFLDCFIKVGASGFLDNGELAVTFSNFGKNSVDVFAPGLGINSTIPGNRYEAHSGTSMAAPVVSGLAAVIREYYPRLSARQVKQIIMKTVVQRPALKDLCVSGGVVNAYEALKLAASYTSTD